MEREELMFVSNVTDNINEEDYERCNLLFESLDATSRLYNSCMFVIDFAKQKMVYCTKELLFIDENSIGNALRNNINPYWSLIEEEDLNKMLETRNAYLEYVKGLPIRKKLNHTYIIDYRIKYHNRSYVIAQKFTPLKLRPNGELWLGLFCITNSTHKSCEHIAIFGEGFRCTYDFSKKAFTPFEENMHITKIEKDIISFALKGLTTEQIADEVNRSINTIKTHKSRLFDKLHVKSMAEAITFIQNYNL